MSGPLQPYFDHQNRGYISQIQPVLVAPNPISNPGLVEIQYRQTFTPIPNGYQVQVVQPRVQVVQPQQVVQPRVQVIQPRVQVVQPQKVVQLQQVVQPRVLVVQPISHIQVSSNYPFVFANICR
jgi:hypothetical protein